MEKLEKGLHDTGTRTSNEYQHMFLLRNKKNHDFSFK